MLRNYFLAVLLIFTSVAYSENMSPYTIHVDSEISEKDAEVIARGLGEFNTPFFGNKKTIPLMICLKNKNQKVEGGILAWIRPGIGLLCIDTLWVAEHLRHQGYGTKLLLAAEAEGLKQGCTHSQLETLPFQAAEFYKKSGYVEIGRVEKLYGDHDALYMRKKLVP